MLNTVISVLTQTLVLIIGLIVPRVILANYGSDTNGFTSTITQVFTYMALLEAGISQSARNSLYKPIQANDKHGISYYMSTAKRHYKRMTIIYLVVVLLLSFLLPFILKSNLPYYTISLYVLFEGLASVASFYFVNTILIFLNAVGENYVINIVTLISKMITSIIKIVLALFGLNIIFIQVGFFFVSIVQTAFYFIYMKKKYPWIDYRAAPKNSKLPDKKSYIVTEIAWVVFSSTDLIVISVFLSTSYASVYSVYNMVFVALNGLLTSLYTALNYNLGQTFYRDKEQYCKMHDLFTSVFFGLMTAMMCVSYVLIIPFVRLYTNGVTDINYINVKLPLLFCLIQLISWSRYVPGNLTGIAGFARQTSYVSIVEAVLNLILSIVLVNFFGIEGVLIATVLSLPIKAVWCNWLTERKILKRNPSKTIKIIITNVSAFALTVIIAFFIDTSVDDYLSFFRIGAVLFSNYLVILFFLNAVANKDLLKLKSILTNKL